jgi:twitching motility protein PilT
MSQKNGPLLGRIAVQLKMIDLDQLNQATMEQGRNPEKRLGEILIENGFIDAEQLQKLFSIQKDLIAKHKARQGAEGSASENPAASPSSVSGEGGEATASASAVETIEEFEEADESSPSLELSLPPATPEAEEKLRQILGDAIGAGASDIHLHWGGGVRMRVNGRLSDQDPESLAGDSGAGLVAASLSPVQRQEIMRKGEIDYCLDLEGIGRFRANAYRQQRGFDAIFRSVPAAPPTLEELGLSSELAKFTNFHQGMVLITGPAGCGKSATLAAMVNLINEERDEHILTVEDPIEVIHPSKRCLVNQRHAGRHTRSFARALRGALREDPDVIVIGELRDLETISLAMTAAETGHFVLATLHTNNAVRTINRMIGAFPSNEQGQVRTMLSESLRAVISQRLVPTAEGRTRVPALEVLMINKAIGNLIREEKTVQIRSAMQTGKAHGMYLLEQSLNELVEEGSVKREVALRFAEEEKLITATD